MVEASTFSQEGRTGPEVKEVLFLASWRACRGRLVLRVSGLGGLGVDEDRPPVLSSPLSNTAPKH